MMPQDLEKSTNPDLRASMAAMRRAAEEARRIAIQTNTALVVVRDGVLARVPAEVLREEVATPFQGMQEE